jgi:glycosyltransferase involved in cell wall biosynthesis
MESQLDTPLISVCIPSYNYAHFIRTTIDSALAQTYADFEIVVSDNASTDDTRAILDTYAGESRLRVIHQPENIGIVRNVNCLLREARGEYVVVVGADDAMLPNFLSTCIARMCDSADPVDIVYGGAVICNEALQPVSIQHLPPQIDRPYSRRNEFAALLHMVYILFTATLYRKSTFVELGYLNESRKIAFDWEFLLSAALADKRFACIPEPVVMVRYHENQASSSGNYFFSGDAFVECLDIFEEMVNDHTAWRIRGYEQRLIERLGWYDQMFRDSSSLETLSRFEAMVARLKSYAAAPTPDWADSQPLVSVVLACNGDPGLLERSLDSLEAQNFTNWEAVIVQYEGMSLDGLVKRRNRPDRLRHCFGQSSLPIARVHGMDLTRGLIIAHMHSGAMYAPNHLALAVGHLQGEEIKITVSEAIDSLDLIHRRNYGPLRQCLAMVSGIRNAAAIVDRFYITPVVDMSCVVHRREILDLSGSLSIDQKIAGEWEFLMRSVMRNGLRIINVATVELHYDIGVDLIDRAVTFLHTIDEIYRRYPATDATIARRRVEYRTKIEGCLARQSQMVSTAEGLQELLMSLTGMPLAAPVTA